VTTVAHALDEAGRRLRAAGIEEAELIGTWVVSEVAGLPRLELTLHADRALSPDSSAQLRQHLDRLIRHEPLQYVLGYTSFFGGKILTDPRALIPRPETEILVERVVEACSSFDRPIRIADVGTGTGCISIALALQIPFAEVVSLDVSTKALELARENVRRHRLLDRITLLESDLLEAVSPDVCFDMIVANLPYVTESEINALPEKIARHEPRIALDGGPSGLDFFRRLGPQASTRLARHGRLLLEIGSDQAKAVEGILRDSGYHEITVYPDLSGHDRIVAGQVTPP